MAVQLWAKAKTESDTELQAVKKELGEKLAEVEEERSDATQEVGKLENKLASEEKHNKELIEMVREQEQKIRELELNKKAIQDRYEDLLYIQTKYEKVLQEVGELRGILSQKK